MAPLMTERQAEALIGRIVAWFIVLLMIFFVASFAKCEPDVVYAEDYFDDGTGLEIESTTNVGTYGVNGASVTTIRNTDSTESHTLNVQNNGVAHGVEVGPGETATVVTFPGQSDKNAYVITGPSK